MYQTVPSVVQDKEIVFGTSNCMVSSAINDKFDEW